MTVNQDNLRDPQALPTETNESAPVFPQGTVVLDTAMVVDLDGRAWWVDPVCRSLVRAQ